MSGGGTPSCAHDCEGTDLTGAIVSKINLNGGDFASADLSGARSDATVGRLVWYPDS